MLSGALLGVMMVVVSPPKQKSKGFCMTVLSKKFVWRKFGSWFGSCKI